MNTPTTIFRPIFRYVTTTREADEFVTHIDAALQKVYTVQQQTLDTIILPLFPPPVAQAMHEVFTAIQFAWNNVEEVKTFLQNLKSEVQKLEVLTLTLAYRPTTDEVSNYAEWIRSNLNANTILEINVDQHLIGGAVVIYHGQYIDLSLRKRLDDYFAKTGREMLKKLASKQ